MRRGNHPHWLFIIGLALAILAAPVASFAQVKSSTIHVVVTDSGGARVPEAAVVVMEESTNVKYELQSNSVGEATVPYLPAGKYTVSIKKEGFRPYSQTGLPLASNTTVGVDAVLAIGQTQQVIEVVASAVQLQTESSSVQAATTARTIEMLPNLNQNPLYYAALQSGVVPPKAAFASSGGHDSFGIGFQARGAYSALSVNGGESGATDIQLDGVPILGSDYNSASVLPNAEGIQEVRVMINNFTAENGRGQGVTSIITKSGGNEFHGSGNFRLRNEALNANGFNNNFNKTPRQPFKAQYWGASVGGAIKKDKLFFFTSYEGLAHSKGAFWKMRVPTPLEKKGDFSQTLIADENGRAVPVQLFDPFSVTKIGPNLYQRSPVPNSIIPQPNKYALKLFSYYPDPNQTPQDVYNANNYYKSGKQTYSKGSINTKIDYRLGNKHSIYGAGGIMKGSIDSPTPFGDDNPFWGFPSSGRSSEFDNDKNPYLSLADTVVLSPTMVVDVRLGLTRVVSDSGSKGHDFDFAAVGIPAAVQAIFPDPRQSPDFIPGTFGPLGNTTWGHKRQRQFTQNLTGSVTKNVGRWTLKAGGEFRQSLSNFEDFANGSIAIVSNQGEFSRQYLTSTGANVTENKTVVQNGYAAANLLQGAGWFQLTPGFGVRPAFTARYTALYSQNDWRVNSKLTINLGLRWELQPAPTERYNRISGYDDAAKSPIGTGLGSLAFAGTGDYDRHLWDTHYRDFGPRVGLAYSLNQSTVLRGGFGMTYVPSNTGYAPGPSRFGETAFAPATAMNLFGLENPNGVPAGTFDTGKTTQIIPATGVQLNSPVMYGAGSSFALFNRHNYKDGRIKQFNLALEKRLRNSWFLALTLSGTRGDNLPDGPLDFTNNQFIPQEDLAAWRSYFVSSNGVKLGDQQVQNPFQPETGALLPFSGGLSGRTITRALSKSGNLLFNGFRQSISRGISNYNAAQFRVSHAFSNGFHMDAHYTWSKSMSNYASDMFTNGGTDTGIDALATRGKDRLNIDNNWHLGFADVPHRFVGTFSYDLPFGKGGALELKNSFARFIAGGWSIGGVTIMQSGFPLVVYGMQGSGSLNVRPDRIAGVPIELPKEMQHFYDGKTNVTLPSGRVIKPALGAYLKYNPEAFKGRVVQLANGKIAVDPYWFGNAALTYDDIRGPGRFNTDMSLSRSFRVAEGKSLQFVANVANVFNNTQFTVSGNLATGEVNVTDFPGQIQNFGQLGGHTTNTFDPRNIELKLRFVF